MADRYVGWQEATLNFLASQFDAKTRSFPGTWVKEVTEAVKASGKAGDMNDRALKQTVIPFAKVKADEAQKGGAQVSSRFTQCQLVSPWAASSFEQHANTLLYQCQLMFTLYNHIFQAQCNCVYGCTFPIPCPVMTYAIHHMSRPENCSHGLLNM